MRQLEAEKFELQYKYMCQKYEVRFLTQSANLLHNQFRMLEEKVIK